jgi:hypothetical protein
LSDFGFDVSATEGFFCGEAIVRAAADAEIFLGAFAVSCSWRDVIDFEMFSGWAASAGRVIDEGAPLTVSREDGLRFADRATAPLSFIGRCFICGRLASVAMTVTAVLQKSPLLPSLGTDHDRTSTSPRSITNRTSQKVVIKNRHATRRVRRLDVGGRWRAVDMPMRFAAAQPTSRATGSFAVGEAD